MEFQFGTNWAEFSRVTGGVIGQPLVMEGMFSFFLESAFLRLFLYGERRLSRMGHWWAAFAVFVGSWIQNFNSGTGWRKPPWCRKTIHPRGLWNRWFAESLPGGALTVSIGSPTANQPRCVVRIRTRGNPARKSIRATRAWKSQAEQTHRSVLSPTRGVVRQLRAHADR